MFIIDLENLGKYDDRSNLGTKKEFGLNWLKLFKFAKRQNLFRTWEVDLLILTCICQFSEMKFVIHFF